MVLLKDLVVGISQSLKARLGKEKILTRWKKQLKCDFQRNIGFLPSRWASSERPRKSPVTRTLETRGRKINLFYLFPEFYLLCQTTWMPPEDGFKWSNYITASRVIRSVSYAVSWNRSMEPRAAPENKVRRGVPRNSLLARCTWYPRALQLTSVLILHFKPGNC